MDKEIAVAYDHLNGKFILPDNGITKANRSGVIKWVPGEGVEEVVLVWAKTSSPTTTNVFWSDTPRPSGSKKCMGKIKGNLDQGKTWIWDYNIVCNVGTNNDPIYVSEDPRIQVDAIRESI